MQVRMESIPPLHKDGEEAEVEKRGKEAWSLKKSATIEHVVSIEERLKVESGGVSDSLGFGGNSRRFVGNVGERNLFGDGVRIDGVDSSSAVFASKIVVELNDKEKERKSGKENVLMGVGLMPVGGNGGVGVSGGDGFGRQLVVPVADETPIAFMSPYVQNNHPRDENGGSYQ